MIFKQERILWYSSVLSYVTLKFWAPGPKANKGKPTIVIIPEWKEVKDNIMKINGVSDVNLNLVWEPPWDKDKMSEAAKLELNLWVNKLLL